MAKTTKKDFELFKDECHKWVDRFELNNYLVRFEHKHKDDANASSNSYSHNYTVTFNLRKEIDYGKFDEELSKEEFIKHLAKHEVIHCLLGRISTVAESRFLVKDELTEAEEELVIKLEKIIPEK